MNPNINLDVGDLKMMLDSNQSFRLIDVREPGEFELARIPRAELIPLSVFAQKAPEALRPEEEIVLVCHHGGRSMQALMWLKNRGYLHLKNLAGGIEQWSLQIDPSVARY
ncbi:MAG: rhodanese-like domain-containing protein [Verrucomicrobiae bacterium]|nr:rhodanese-like domain-containing protein [Verrucomicrobiae bacterium]